MSLVRENITPPKYMEHLIFGALFVLALGLLTSTSILALSHILMLVPCVYFAIHTNWKEMPKSAWALLGLSIAIMLSVAVNQDIMVKGWKPIFKVKYFLFGFFSIVPFHWWIKNKMTEKQLKVLLYTFLIATTVATVSGLCGTFFGYNPLLMKAIKIGERNGGLFGMLMNYAHNMSYFLVLLFGLILMRDKIKHLVNSKFLILVFIINLIGLYFSYTRGAWLAVIAGIPMYFYKDHKNLFWGLLSGLIILGVVGYFVAGKKVVRPESENQRVSQWKAALYAFKERPVLGFGYLNFEDHSTEIKKRYGVHDQGFGGHAHSNIFEVIGALGVVGIVFYVLWHIFWLREVTSSMELAFLVAFFVGGLTQSTISLGINLFFVMAVVSVMKNNKSESFLVNKKVSK